MYPKLHNTLNHSSSNSKCTHYRSSINVDITIICGHIYKRVLSCTSSYDIRLYL